MSSFAKNLQALEPVDRIARLELYNTGPQPEAVIENQPGSSGSVAVYYHLARKYGAITTKAAQEGLSLYAEYAAEAERDPGAHPNIDRLLRVVAEGIGYSVRPIFQRN